MYKVFFIKRIVAGTVHPLGRLHDHCKFQILKTMKIAPIEALWVSFAL
jgi:hypothetical protein